VVDSEPPRCDQALREVGLVALQAALLTRRIFLPAAGRDDLTPEQWQLLLALALIDTAPSPYEHPTASAESLAIQLTLDREYVHELLFALMSDGLVAAGEDADEDPPRFRLSKRGWEAARAYIERAGQFLPGWPPERWRRAPDD
jgi:hypothetical protein